MFIIIICFLFWISVLWYYNPSNSTNCNITTIDHHLFDNCKLYIYDCHTDPSVYFIKDSKQFKTISVSKQNSLLSYYNTLYSSSVWNGCNCEQIQQDICNTPLLITYCIHPLPHFNMTFHNTESTWKYKYKFEYSINSQFFSNELFSTELIEIPILIIKQLCNHPN